MTYSIKVTDEQKKVIDSIFDPFIKIPLSGSHDGGEIYVYSIEDDTEVTLFVIQEDGSYFTESLEDGFGYGWTRRDEEGELLED